jgi:pyrroloquinoline quinone biosynthesis protein D
VTPSGRPVLARRARIRPDRVGNGHFLLAPERGFRLNESAAAILQLCDGRRSLLEIAQKLAPPARESVVLSDVMALVSELQRRGLLEVSEP